MNIWTLDESYNSITIVDDFVSFIWSVRYNKEGDFEIVVLANREAFTTFKKDLYLWIAESDRLMIIENVYLDTSATEGDRITVTGRSLESLLHRRIIWSPTTLSGKFQACVKRLIDENIINPLDSSRRIPNFEFRDSTDPAITSLRYDGAFDGGEDLYDVVQSMCEEASVGFRILPNYENSGFIFELYAGKDYSWDQDTNPPVVFSSAYENLLSSSYFESTTNDKNAMRIVDSSETPFYSSATGNGYQPGIHRREVFFKSDLRFEDVAIEVPPLPDKDADMTPNDRIHAIWEHNQAQAKYDLQQRDWQKSVLPSEAKRELKKYKSVKALNGEIDPTVQFVYKKDFDIGDIVQVKNQYDQEFKSRVSEIIVTQDSTGQAMYPTFELVEDDDQVS